MKAADDQVTSRKGTKAIPFRKQNIAPMPPRGRCVRKDRMPGSCGLPGGGGPGADRHGRSGAARAEGRARRAERGGERRGGWARVGGAQAAPACCETREVTKPWPDRSRSAWPPLLDPPPHPAHRRGGRRPSAPSRGSSHSLQGGVTSVPSPSRLPESRPRAPAHLPLWLSFRDAGTQEEVCAATLARSCSGHRSVPIRLVRTWNPGGAAGAGALGLGAAHRSELAKDD